MNLKSLAHPWRMTSVILAALALTSCATKQRPPSPPAAAGQPAAPDRLQWWRDARFGMFIHWGPVSLTGQEIGWARGSQVPIEEYDQLYLRFNPTNFNADA